MSTKGYYSMGLAGYEVEVGPDDSHVLFSYISPTEAEPSTRPRKAKIRYTADGRAYFLACGHRIHLDECLRTDF